MSAHRLRRWPNIKPAVSQHGLVTIACGIWNECHNDDIMTITTEIDFRSKPKKAVASSILNKQLLRFALHGTMVIMWRNYNQWSQPLHC